MFLFWGHRLVIVFIMLRCRICRSVPWERSLCWMLMAFFLPGCRNGLWSRSISRGAWHRNKDRSLTRRFVTEAECKWINSAAMTTRPSTTCGRVMPPDWRSSCLPAGQTRCRFDTWSRSWGQRLVPGASSPAQSCLKTTQQPSASGLLNTFIQPFLNTFVFRIQITE